MPALTVEVWSDVACPWCWVGKRHLDRASRRFGHAIRVIWRAFELDPEAPALRDDGIDYVERLAAKYHTTRDGAQSMVDSMTARGAASGLDFHFDILRPANTFDAHRLLHHAKTRGVQHALKERLMTAYFSEGELISDHAVLARLATEVSVPRDEVEAMLASDAWTREVRTEEAVAHELGITGVPFFVVAGRYAVEGAQPADAILEVMQRAMEETSGSTMPTPGGTCGPEGCILPTSG